MSADHSHDHAASSKGGAFVVGITLNVGLVAIQVVFGLLAHSMALLADAGHNLSDVLGLVVAGAATVLARRRPTARHTYGLRSSSILAAVLNALFLLVATGALSWEAIGRLRAPTEIATGTVMWVAAAAILINGGVALLFAKGGEHDLNVKAAYLHMLSDAATSFGVLVSALVIRFTGWHWLDPAVTLLIGAIIVLGTWRLLRDSVNLALDAVPANIELAEVRGYLSALPGVTEVHDLHVWAMSTTEACLTAHLVSPAGRFPDGELKRVTEELDHRFHIEHVTLQVEGGEMSNCCHVERGAASALSSAPTQKGTP